MNLRELRHEVSQMRKKVNRRLESFAKGNVHTHEWFILNRELKETGIGVYNRKKRMWQVRSTVGLTKGTLERMKTAMDVFIDSPTYADIKRPKEFENYNIRSYIAERIRARTHDPYMVVAFMELAKDLNADDEMSLIEAEERVYKMSHDEAIDIYHSRQIRWFEDLMV